jgi:hypothetical protein
MKRFLVAFALTCALSGVSLAADIPTCGLTADEPITTEPASPGDIPSTGITSPGDMPTCGLSVLLTAFGLVF